MHTASVITQNVVKTPVKDQRTIPTANTTITKATPTMRKIHQEAFFLLELFETQGGTLYRESPHNASFDAK
ncbi:hypothetical protein Leryth_025537 [Lithospermum erythrorhizon]|nr:hypothetical protein Leryth_025537 [Lithospermum erythrorhizon]